jgi:hypothetical protein
MGHDHPQKTSPLGAWLVVLVMALAISPPALYAGVYGYARVTHRLVNYGHFIARPHATHGIGFTWWEVVFLPATELESGVRGVLGV